MNLSELTGVKLLGILILVAVVATGGLSSLIAPHSDTIEHVEPWLTLHGLRIVYERNVTSKGT